MEMINMTARLTTMIVTMQLLLTTKALILRQTTESTPFDTTTEITKCDSPEANASQVVRFTNMGLLSIPDNFIESPYVSYLSLRDNNIQDISSLAFDRLPNLIYLDLTGNSIPLNKLLAIRRHKKLSTLIADNNDMQRSPDNYYHMLYEYHDLSNPFPNLETLYLRNNRLTEFDVLLRAKVPNLKSLDLSDNDIHMRQEFFSTLPLNLTHLYLEGNSISWIPPSGLINLIHLSLDRNALMNLCNHYCPRNNYLELRGASKLQHLSLSMNQIENIESDSFDETTDLMSLDLSANKIEVIRKGTFDSLVSLRNLTISGNQLKIVPDVCQMRSLEYMSLTDNQIAEIPAGSFCESSMLKVLLLNDNPLQAISTETFLNLTKLEHLDLSGTRLRHLPDNWMSSQTSLRVLFLNRNFFSSFEDISLMSADSLHDLYIQNNPINYLSTQDLIYLPDLTIHFNNEGILKSQVALVT